MTNRGKPRSQILCGAPKERWELAAEEIGEGGREVIETKEEFLSNSITEVVGRERRVVGCVLSSIAMVPETMNNLP